MTYRKKLIEVALPLDAINKESAREKSIRHGHPSTLHLWWARRPLAACRAVLFASLVDDPSNDLPEEEAKVERDRLFGILEELVKWENSNDENVLGRARAEIMRSTGGNPPPVLDPFCGGGSIPLEAQRLGLEAHGSDLNPVAVLITKALIEIPPKFAGQPPVNPESRKGIDRQRGQLARGAGARRGRALLRQVDARRGREEDRPPLPQGTERGDRDRLALGAHRPLPQPRLRRDACRSSAPSGSPRSRARRRGSSRSWTARRRRCASRSRRARACRTDPPKVGRGAKFRCLVCEQVCRGQIT